MEPLSLLEYEQLAREVLDPAVWAYYSGGANDEVTLRENRAAFERLKLLPRIMGGIESARLGTTVLGTPVSLPVLVPPMALHGLACEEGECATARAAGAAGTLMTVSTEASRSLEEVAAAAPEPLWFQVYVYPDRGVTESLVRRAAAAGYRAIVLTADSPRWGRHERSLRRPSERLMTRGANLKAADYYDPALGYYPLGWRDLEWLCSLTELPVVVKGVLHPEDAELAAGHGASAVVVSNHGGRQLDGVPASIEALPAVAEAAAGEVEVYLDSGVRRGTDVLKALALGARAVMVGRPVLWGLAAAGEAGARRVLELLREELEAALVLCGLREAGSVSREVIYSAGEEARRGL